MAILLLKLSAVKPAMVLAKPVLNILDVLLLQTGVLLTEKNIRMLKSWGIPEVWVNISREDEKNAELELSVKKNMSIGSHLQEKFSEVLSDPVMAEIMRVACKRLEKQTDKHE